MFCPCCESEDVTVTRVSVDAKQIGLPGGRLSNVEQFECDECGETTINVPAHGAVVKEYRKQLAHLTRDLTSAEFSFLRRSLGVTGKAYADAIQISNVTISRIENADSVPAVQQGMIRAFTLLDLESGDTFKQLTSRDVAEVVIDVAVIERRQPREISDGWQELPRRKPVPSNVVIFRRPTAANRPAEPVVFESADEDGYRPIAQCH